MELQQKRQPKRLTLLAEEKTIVSSEREREEKIGIREISNPKKMSLYLVSSSPFPSLLGVDLALSLFI